MNRFIVSLGIMFAFLLSLSVPATLHAQELSESMTQGDFALWLVKAIGAQGKLSPAANNQDAVDFLSRIGVIPEGGWEKNEPISSEWLASLLDDSEAGNLSFEELVEAVRDHVQSIFDETELGVFGPQASGSGSGPA